MARRIDRRSFVKLSAAAAPASLLLDWRVAAAEGGIVNATTFGHHRWNKPIGEYPAICPFCAVGCGVIAAVENGHVTSIEGDPDNPINAGRLCPKGMALLQEKDNAWRQLKVLYRAPYATEWQPITYDEAVARVAANVKRTRDAGFVERDGGVLVNRCESIAWMGSSAIKNEEAYLATKFARALGIVYQEHQARL